MVDREVPPDDVDCGSQIRQDNGLGDKAFSLIKRFVGTALRATFVISSAEMSDGTS